MATVRFFLQSKRKPATVYVSLSVKAGKVFKRKTDYSIDPDNWSTETHLPKKGGDTKQKNLKVKLEKLKTTISENLNEVEKGMEITCDWLQNQIDMFAGKIKTTEKDLLTNCIQDYIDYLPRKKQRNGKRGVTPSTIKKYKTLKVKIDNFQKHRNKKVTVKDVGLKMIDELEKYFLETDKLGENTTGRYIKFVKTVCLWANTQNNIPAHMQLKQIKGYTEDAAKVVLSFDELETIENTTFKREALENAKDWLIIGCYIGQRVSDLLSLTSENLIVKNGVEFIELTQKKTGKYVLIPLHWKVKQILDKRNGNFPRYLSDVKFNIHIKNVCKEAEINTPTEGGKMVKNEKTKITRKEYGKFPKWELISSHVCRRSYATNFYGEMPTSWLISITAHSTEKQFLEYVGKPAIDTAQQIAEFYAKLALQAKKEPQMQLLKKAN
jgi:integrase